MSKIQDVGQQIDFLLPTLQLQQVQMNLDCIAGHSYLILSCCSWKRNCCAQPRAMHTCKSTEGKRLHSKSTAAVLKAQLLASKRSCCVESGAMHMSTLGVDAYLFQASLLCTGLHWSPCWCAQWPPELAGWVMLGQGGLLQPLGWLLLLQDWSLSAPTRIYHWHMRCYGLVKLGQERRIDMNAET